jgi:hypothetical protein
LRAFLLERGLVFAKSPAKLRERMPEILENAEEGTSGVILSTFTLAADEDYSITILSDACADPKASLHEELMTNLFPRSATVLTVDQWIASLPAKG